MMRSMPGQRLRGCGLSRLLVVPVLALVGLGAAVAVHSQPAPHLAAAGVKDKGTVLDAVIDMTCFPKEIVFPVPPGIGGPPPCDTSDITVYSSPNPSGRAHLTVMDDDTVHFDIELQGILPDQTVTAWLIWYFQFLYPCDESSFPCTAPTLPNIFVSVDPNKDIVSFVPFPLPPCTDPPCPSIWVPFAVAAHSVPLARTGAGYTEGLGREPNQIVIDEAGNGGLTVKLDYNPLKPHQGPLRNGLANTHQGAAPAGSTSFQPPCCGLVTLSGEPVHQPIGSSFLREFDPATGFQKLEANGRPKLVRSPVPAVFISIISSLDKHTKGINPGLPYVPELLSFGDHVILGVFDLRAFHQQ
jgi:hypothetical protein